jgi:hypothetical protein
MSELRVFVSSVVSGFGEYREAARRGILEAGAVPVLVNEETPAGGMSARNACLDAIDSCDAFVTVVGGRGGFITPSGKLVVEEEYEHARARKLRVLAFLQSVERDERATRFANQISNYVDGTFRRTFETAADLERSVAEAVAAIPSRNSSPMTSPASIRDVLLQPPLIRNDASLRLVLASERDEEIFSPQRLTSRELLDIIFDIAHSRVVGLLEYESPKTHEIDRNHLIVEQHDDQRSRSGSKRVRLSLSESGLLVLDANVTGRAPRDDFGGLSTAFVVAIPDIENVLRTFFAFVRGMWDNIDPHKRHHQLLYDVRLMNLEFRRVVRDANPRSSTAMNMRGNDPVMAFPEPRRISRDDLKNPDAEIARIVTVLEREANR